MLYSIVKKEIAQNFPQAFGLGDYWVVPNIGSNFTDLDEENKWLLDIRLGDYLLYIFAGEEGDRERWQSALKKADARLEKAIGSSLFKEVIKWNSCVIQDAKTGGRMGCPGPCILYLYLDQHRKFNDLQYFWFFIATLKGLTREEINKIDQVYSQVIETNQGKPSKEVMAHLHLNFLQKIIERS